MISMLSSDELLLTSLVATIRTGVFVLIITMLSGTTPCTCQDESASEMSNEKGVPSVPTTLKLTCPAMLGVLPGAVLLLVPKAPPHPEIRAQPHAIRAVRTRALIDCIVLHIVMVRYFFSLLRQVNSRRARAQQTR